MSIDLGSSRALYSISVAAELTGVHPQALRGYEAKGLVTPFRTDGGTRRYSGQDVARINRITTLLAGGHNLAGVQQILELEAEVERLQDEVERLRGHGGRGLSGA